MSTAIWLRRLWHGYFHAGRVINGGFQCGDCPYFCTYDGREYFFDGGPEPEVDNLLRSIP